jgi:hypothetical protein
MSTFKNRLVPISLVLPLVLIGGCAVDAPSEADADEARDESVQVDVDTSATPKMRWWCTDGYKDVIDCRSGTCTQVYTDCLVVCGYVAYYLYGGCYH